MTTANAIDFERAKILWPRQQDFFDVQRAKTFWTTIKTRKSLEQTGSVCDDLPGWKKWDDTWRRKAEYARHPVLELFDDSMPNADKIEFCHDLKRTFNVFFGIFANKITYNSGYDFNAFPPDTCAMYAEENNIFTHQCNDTPDWRSADQVKEYDAAVAKTRKRRAAAAARQKRLRAEARAIEKAVGELGE